MMKSGTSHDTKLIAIMQWASELGILNKSWPVSIIHFKQVPPGTNGGVSSLGLLASLAGGATIGLTGAISMSLQQKCHGVAWELVIVGALAGLGGSLVSTYMGDNVFMFFLGLIPVLLLCCCYKKTRLTRCWVPQFKRHCIPRNEEWWYLKVKTRMQLLLVVAGIYWIITR